MKTKLIRLRARLVLTALWLALTAAGFAQNLSNHHITASGDAEYSWNSKYGPWGYNAGGNAIGTNLAMGGTYGNDYTIGVMEIPIVSLAGATVSSATLWVYSNGFSTGYYYGSASVGWVNTGSMPLTGNVVTDGLGPTAASPSASWTIYNSDYEGSPTDPRNGQPGWRSFTVTTYLQADIDAGRAWSTFSVSGSRDTWGSLATAESGSGAYLVVSSNAIPEPSTYAACAGLLALGLAVWRRRRLAFARS